DIFRAILSIFFLSVSAGVFAETPVAPTELRNALSERRSRVPEFELIQKEAALRGLRVWLFGGTAAAFAHYVRWDLLREKGDSRFQPDRFDYDFTNIYR